METMPKAGEVWRDKDDLTITAKIAEIAALQGVIDRVRGECLKDANDRHGPGDAWERGVAFTRAAILALLPPTGGES